MTTLFLIAGLVVLILGLWGTGLWCLTRWLHRRWVRATRRRPGQRLAIVLAGAFALCLPYVGPNVLFKAYERRAVLARVPEPLRVASIEYRVERSSGWGPSASETGFVVYRLTHNSAAWARARGQALASDLPGGPRVWRSTPVDESGARNTWHHYDGAGVRDRRASVAVFLDKYGFLVPLEPSRVAEADIAINRTGAFYSYGRGGSVTIVDPARANVYFAYAG